MLHVSAFKVTCITQGFLFLCTEQFPMLGLEEICIQSTALREQVKPASLFLGSWKLEAFVSSPSCGCWAHLTRLCSHKVERQPTGVWNVRVPRTCRVVNDLNAAGTACDMWVLSSMPHLISFSSYMIEWMLKYSRVIRDRILPVWPAWNDGGILKCAWGIVLCVLSVRQARHPLNVMLVSQHVPTHPAPKTIRPYWRWKSLKTGDTWVADWNRASGYRVASVLQKWKKPLHNSVCDRRIEGKAWLE